MEKNEKMLNEIYNLKVEKITTKIEKNWRREKERIESKEIENKKIGYFTQESYKQGFIDGVNLMINCLK